MTWKETGALGVISLAVAPNGLGKKNVDALRSKIIASADAYRSFIEHQGYRVPIDPAAEAYPWGSNSFVLNNLIVLALAHDFTKKPEYAHAVADGMNYLLGTNPLAMSYVTGYGEHSLENPHHRFWSHQANRAFPSAPPGAVSGGPNSAIQDPYAQAAGLSGCAPQTCFIDHIESWSTNEITINWNAPLAWVAAFLDEKSR
jgi:endoglucanase